MDVYRSIIITGGGGMLAHALIDALKARGHTATPVRRAECDIADVEDVSQMFRQHRPSLLLNCAAHTGVDLCEDEPEKANAINGDGPGHLATLAAEYGTRLVHYSTDFVFDGQCDRPYRPDDRPNPVSAYGASKLLGEQRIQELSPPGWLILRTAWLFGGHGSCFPQVMIKMARAGRPLRVVCDQFGSPTYTVDLAAATLRLVDRGLPGIFHVTNSGVTNWHDFAAATLKEFGIPADLAPVTTAEWLRMRPKQAKRPAYSVLDGAQYTVATGHSMRLWTQALRDYRESQAAAPDLS
jgi:dTDP-4-dehydrorhamnose reductase